MLLDFGLWTLGYGPWVMDLELWTLSYGLCGASGVGFSPSNDPKLDLYAVE